LAFPLFSLKTHLHAFASVESEHGSGHDLTSIAVTRAVVSLIVASVGAA
jgi:hypothetical protein